MDLGKLYKDPLYPILQLLKGDYRFLVSIFAHYVGLHVCGVALGVDLLIRVWP